MRTHLPECPFADADHDALAVRRCICTRLRACEARVREDERPDPESAEADAYDHGYAAALRDAVGAVMALYDRHDACCDDPRCGGPDREFAVAAIEVLAIEVLGGSRGLDDCYAAALRDAVEAVRGRKGRYNERWPNTHAAFREAIAAIEALGGER